jgi:iron(III) transport system substrate-binding protein
MTEGTQRESVATSTWSRITTSEHDRRSVLRLLAASGGAAALSVAGLRTSLAQDAEATPTGQRLTIYSGRNENLVGPLIEQFTAATGIEADVRYAGTAELAVTLLEEGDASPADVFFGQDAGALGLLSQEGKFIELPAEVLDLASERFRSAEGLWVGTSARARVIVYNTDMLTEDEVPNTVAELLDPKWDGQIGWAPENASFQAFVTAFRMLEGDDAAREWLEGMLANNVISFGGSNADIVRAVGNGEIPLGLVNHYYLYGIKREEGDDFPVANHYLDAGDVGALINVAGAGILASGAHQDEALAFVEYLLSDEAQTYFAQETSEYPVVDGVESPVGLPPVDEVGSPDIDLNDLADLQGTVELLTEVGAL